MRKLIASMVLICGVCTLALAQQSEGNRAPPRPGSLTISVPTGAVREYSRTFNGKLLEVDTDRNQFVFADSKGGSATLVVSKDTRLKADKKTELADKRDIVLADFKPGQFVKLTLRVEDQKVLELRLKPPPKN